MKNDMEKTKNQMAKELAVLRKRITELEPGKSGQCGKTIEESETRYRTIFQSAAEGILIADIETKRFIDANPAICRIMGYSKEELLGMDVSQIHPAEDLAHIVSEFEAQARGEKTLAAELPCLRKDGTVIFADINTAAATIDGRNCNIGFFTDVTARKSVEDALRKSEQRFRDIAENALEWIWEVDMEGRYTYVSPVVKKILGFSPEELVGRYFYDLFHPDIRGQLRATAFHAFEKGRPFREFINPNVHKNGETVWLSTSGIAMLDDHGNRIGYRGMDTDITERKLAENQLNAEKERLAVTLRSIGDGLMALDEKGNIVLLNKVAEVITGYSQKEALGRPLGEIFHIIDKKTREHYNDPLEKVMAAGKRGLPNQTVLIGRDGIEKILSVSGAPIMDRDSQTIGAVLVFRDITKQRRMEEELQKIHKIESISTLAGGIAHDFNNILTGILGNISLAKVIGTSDSKVLNILDAAEKAAFSAKDLTQQLLTFSKGGTPMIKTVSLVDLIEDAASFSTHGSNVTCRFSLPVGLSHIRADEGQIKQVLNNLLINATQAIPHGGVVEVMAENVRIGKNDILPLDEGEYVRTSIADKGIGIHPEDLPKIFDLYFTTKQKGSGLGLAISYSIARMHNGHITVESKPGVGTTFHVYLPASKEKPAPTGDTMEVFTITDKKILVLDDEEVIRETIRKMLEHLGCGVEIAREGKEALELFRKARQRGEPFDAVILDLTIRGGMGGKEAIRELLAIDPDIKAIVSSGYSNDPIIAEYGKYGFKGAIIKPFKINELGKILYKVMTGND